jgi:1-acyl-sn-glycerol-3-phosphate acyltransferase
LHVRTSPTPRPLTFDESFGERWARRVVTGPVLLAATPLFFTLLPGVLPVASVTDLARGTRWTATRFTLALGASLALHVAGLGGVFGAWLGGRRWAGAPPDRERALEQRLQAWWGNASWTATKRLYRMDLHICGDDCLAPGPVLLLCRHTSLLDTLLPLLVASRHDMGLRYVMKRELLWDPCLDAIGHRWPTAFVRRGHHDPLEVEHVAHLADGVGEHDGIVLYPEGTRFSPEKRARSLEAIRAAQPARYERASRLRHVLPPHPGGPLALLDRAPNLDVVFFAHVGLEGANHFEDLWDGALLDAQVQVELWRVRHADVPRGAEARVAWLDQQWTRMDDWVAAHRLREGVTAE